VRYNFVKRTRISSCKITTSKNINRSIGRYFTIAVPSHIREVSLQSPLFADILPDFNNNCTCATPWPTWRGGSLVWFTIIKADLTFRRSGEERATPWPDTDERLRDIKKTLPLSASSFSFPIANLFFPSISVSLSYLIVRNALSESSETVWWNQPGNCMTERARLLHFCPWRFRESRSRLPPHIAVSRAYVPAIAAPGYIANGNRDLLMILIEAGRVMVAGCGRSAWVAGSFRASAMHSRARARASIIFSDATCKRRAVIVDNESDRESDDITPGDL